MQNLVQLYLGKLFIQYIRNRMLSVGWVESSGCSEDAVLEVLALCRSSLFSFQTLLGLNLLCSSSLLQELTLLFFLKEVGQNVAVFFKTLIWLKVIS